MFSCIPPQCPLPQELVDAVINQVDLRDRTSLKTLSACSTVSKSFYPASRARLWTRLKIPPYTTRRAELYDVLIAAGDLAPLVQNLLIYCEETFPVQLLYIFPNVVDIEFIGDFDDLPNHVLKCIAETWNITTVSFQDAAFNKAALTAMIPLWSKVKRICLIDSGSVTPSSLEKVKHRSIVCSPESLSIDLTGDGIALIKFILANRWLMSFEHVRHLAISSFTVLAVDVEETREMVHRILDMIPVPLQELSFREYNSSEFPNHRVRFMVLNFNQVSSNNDEEVLPIATIARIFFEVHQEAKPLQTLDWWVRNITNAWTNHRDKWAIKEIYIAVNESPQRRFVDLSAPGVWHALDSILSVVKLNKVVVRVLTRRVVDDVHVLQFDQALRSAFALSRERDIFCWGDIWHVL